LTNGIMALHNRLCERFFQIFRPEPKWQTDP
jgi:hypothetical protein